MKSPAPKPKAAPQRRSLQLRLEQLEDRTVPSSITGLAPNFGPTSGATGVIVSGSGFTGASAVKFGTTAAMGYFVLSDSMIEAFSPPEPAGVVDVVVTAPSGTSSIVPGDRFTYQGVQATTSTALYSSSDPSSSGQSVTLTALVSSSGSGTPTGTVTFQDGATVLGTGTVSSGGQATFTTSALSVGYHTITAVYSGDANFVGSTSNPLSQAVAAPTWTVVNTLDVGLGDLVLKTGDLRFCLNNAGNGQSIVFDIVDSNGNRLSDPTINVTSALPAISNAITLDGYSQAGGEDPSAGPQVQINGASIVGGPVAAGLDVSAGGVTIQGLAIYKFSGNGVLLDNPAGSAGDVLQGCYVGTDIAGDANMGNGTGVLVEGPNDTVGYATDAATTVVSGNTNDGIDVSGANATGALIVYDWVGVNVIGVAALPNGGNGVVLNGDGSSDYDVVSGNDGTGILVTGSSNLIYGDKIGVGKDGATQDANGKGGVNLSQASDTFVGLATEPRNIISGNTGNGVSISGGYSNEVSNNYIGLDTNGNVLGNTGSGVAIDAGAQNNAVGGTAQGAGNVISGNLGDGVDIAGAETSQNLVAGNFIGTDVNGATSKDNNQAATGNKFYGVNIAGGASANTVGSTQSVVPNVISGNGVGQGGDGVIIAGANQNVIVASYIGTDKAGATAIANGGDGVYINQSSTGNTIGGTVAGSLNVISGNSGNGINISDGGTSENRVWGDYIGTDATGTKALANGGNGVMIQKGATLNTIGGTAAGSLNVISGNTGSGVLMTDSGTSKNTVAGDYIGTDFHGAAAIANGGDGVSIKFQASNNTVGALAPAQGADTTVTVISGNTDAGVAIYDSANKNQVINCYIGTDWTGMKAFGNLTVGIDLEGDQNTIGGQQAGSTNVISGNGKNNPAVGTGYGILIAGSDAKNNVIEGDYIGTDKTGNAQVKDTNGIPVGNYNSGVYVSGDGGGNTIGGTVQAAMCVISGNGYTDGGGGKWGYGVDLTTATGETVEGDNIGVGANGNALANLQGWLNGDQTKNTVKMNNHQ